VVVEVLAHPGVALAFAPGERAAGAREEDVASGRFYESQVGLRARSGLCAEGFDLHLVPYQTRSEAREWRYEVLVFAMTPRSRGRLELRSRDWRTPPRINPRFLSDRTDHDLMVLADGVGVARRVVAGGPLAEVARETAPGPRGADGRKLAVWIRSTVGGYAHSVGTCRMGRAGDPGAVVNGGGRVHGLDNVYVADASIIPRIPRANTNLTCMLLGVRIAELLAEA
jgi:choline dehydrogenase